MSRPKLFRRRNFKAVQWTGENDKEVVAFIGSNERFVGLYSDMNDLEWARDRIGDQCVQRMLEREYSAAMLVLYALGPEEEWVGVNDGDWIVEDHCGFLAIPDDVFSSIYECVDDQ